MKLNEIKLYSTDAAQKAEKWFIDNNIGTFGMIIHDSGNIDATSDVVINGVSKLGVKFNVCDGSFTISSDHIESLEGSPDKIVGGNFYCSRAKKLKSLKGSPRIITGGPGSGKAYGNVLMEDGAIESLEGCPDYVDGTFNLSSNNISQIDHAPKKCNILKLQDNKITSLKGIEKILKDCHINTIDLGGNQIKGPILGLILTPVKRISDHYGDKRLATAIEIVNKHLGKGKAGVLDAQNELLAYDKLDLEEFASL